MMQADIAVAVPPRRRRLRRRDPERGPAVPPAGHFAKATNDLEAEETEQALVESPRSLVVADANNDMVDAQNLNHLSALAWHRRPIEKKPRRISKLICVNRH